MNFRASGDGGAGTLNEPSTKYLIIDGQHRLAALHFYMQERPDDAATINVPCIIFDGRSEDFATEMFVIINSTPTRINKSHLVDLYDRVSFAAPDRKFAARLVEKLYGEGDSPLRYRINRLGGRSQRDKWVLQAELFNELHRWVRGRWRSIQLAGGSSFFFQAEDGIRGTSVTGVQTCALPIFAVRCPLSIVGGATVAATGNGRLTTGSATTGSEPLTTDSAGRITIGTGR